jgi:hypothetical protein
MGISDKNIEDQNKTIVGRGNKKVKGMRTAKIRPLIN